MRLPLGPGRETPDSETAKLRDCLNPRLPNSEAAKLPNSETAKLRKTAKLRAA